MEQNAINNSVRDSETEEKDSSLGKASLSQTSSDLINNLRTQLALFQIYNFTRRHVISSNKQIRYVAYRNLRKIKSFCLFIYVFMVFFEKPFYCFKNSTLPFISPTECNDNVAFMSLPQIKESIYRTVELLLLLSFMAIQLIFHRERKALGNFTKNYHIIQIILYSLMTISLIDIIIGLIFDIFPLINFILKGFIIIFLIRNLRNAWLDIIKLLWKTRTVFFLLFCNIFVFGLMGFFLFKESSSGDFSSLSKSMYSLYILLSTCNFPDVMLGTFEVSKLSVFYFVIYITINIFIILSLLKALYYSSYVEILQDKARLLIDYIRKGNNDLSVFKLVSFHAFLIKLNKKFSFTQEEYSKICEIVGLKNELIFNEMLRTYEKRENQMRLNKIFIFFSKKKVEIIINIIDLILIYFLFTSASYNNLIVVFQIIWCSFFILECLIYLHYLGMKRMIMTNLLRCIFYFINFLLFVCLISLEIYYIMGMVEEFNILFEYCKPLIVLRAIRIFVLLSLFKEFQNIFSTLHNMKTIFSGHLMNLFSFFYIFSTVSMLMTGGTIQKDSFINNKEIPNNYYHINFNDYGSSFLTCFALMMINNVNILAKSLSINLHEHQMFFNSYFATFYFFSTLIILNICQTLLLEMYLTIKANKL